MTVCEVCEGAIERGRQEKSASIRWMHADPAKCRENIRADERERIEKFAIPAWREEIAQEIEAMCPHEQDTDPTCPYMQAARIARGGEPDA